MPEEQRVYRVKVVHVFLRTATPPNKLTHFRGLLEENAVRFSDRRLMADIVPFISSKEKEMIKQEIAGKYLCVIFDGMT